MFSLYFLQNGMLFFGIMLWGLFSYGFSLEALTKQPPFGLESWDAVRRWLLCMVGCYFLVVLWIVYQFGASALVMPWVSLLTLYATRLINLLFSWWPDTVDQFVLAYRTNFLVKVATWLPVGILGLYCLYNIWYGPINVAPSYWNGLLFLILFVLFVVGMILVRTKKRNEQVAGTYLAFYRRLSGNPDAVIEKRWKHLVVHCALIACAILFTIM